MEQTDVQSAEKNNEEGFVMFCKWCGKAVNPSERSCPSCGRELPSLSECGGFYNLVPAARNVETGRRKSDESPSLGKANPENELKQEKRTNESRERRRRKTLLLPAIVCAAAIISLILLAIQQIRLAGISDRIKCIEQRVEEDQIKLQRIEDGQIDAEKKWMQITSQIEGDRQATDAEKNGYHINLLMEGGGSTEVDTDGALYRIALSNREEPEKRKNALLANCYKLDSIDAAISAEILCQFHEEEQKWVLNPSVDINDTELGTMRSVHYTWQHRSNWENEWSNFEINEGDNTEISIERAEMRRYGGQLSLRCVITWQGTTGKTLEITLGNIMLQDVTEES